MTLKSVALETCVFIVGGSVVLGLEAIGVKSHIYSWMVGILTGYAIIWAGIYGNE